MRGPVESDPHDMEDESFPPLPPPHSPGQGGQEDGDPFTAGEGEDGDVSKLAEVPAAKRKGVKRPQPKLDSQRLISDRGLPALRTLFDNVHFKGKGHEASDLRLLMQKMENWAHRLFPKLQFEDFIDRLEKLGNKKEVQTCLKRIRLDMPLTHEDFMGNGEEEPASEMQMFRDPDPFSRASVSDDDDHRPIHSTPAPTPTPTISSPPAAASLTEEQQRRIELNKQRALERRLARQQQQQQLNDSQTEDEPTLKDEPASGVSNDQNDQNADVDRDEADLQPELNKDSEPSAETGQGREEEEEGGMKIDLDADLQPSSKSEDADEH